MSFLGWVALSGALLLGMALSSAWVQRMPISTAIVYLAVGMALGPLGLDALRVDLTDSAPLVEHLTELAVVSSLFIGGLKLRLSIRDPAWRAAFLLAGPVMLGCIGATALAIHVLFGLEGWLSLLIASALAPTDPVLASAVSVNDAGDRDRLRYGLSGEAGLNDGAAFPFVLLALAWHEHGSLGSWLGGWALHRLVWAVPVALVLGFAVGKAMGLYAIHQRSRERDLAAPSDFFSLALIALVYAGTEAIGAFGFLAVFAAGVGLRRAEMETVRDNPHPDVDQDHHPPAETLVPAEIAEHHLDEPAVAAGVLVAESLSFGHTAERILEVLLVVAVGATVGVYWDPRGLLLAGLLFLVIRPVVVHLFLRATPTTGPQRWMMAMFGVRGIGSLYYVAYAVVHGVDGDPAREIIGLTVSVVAISILLHGIAATPALARYERTLADRPAPA